MIDLKKFLAFTFILNFVACNSSQDSALATKRDHHQTYNAETKKSVDMKALFGDDYRPGDIGHAFGTILSIEDQSSRLTVDHGPIHGTPIKPSITVLGILEDVNISSTFVGDHIEFLVKKGDDDIYRISAICTMEIKGNKCLDNVLPK